MHVTTAQGRMYDSGLQLRSVSGGAEQTGLAQASHA